MNKVYVLGIDGGTFDLITPWVKSGKLPAFERIMRQGVHGELESTILPYTPQAWTSFMTGTNPGKHGIFGFSRHSKGKYGVEFINAKARMQPALWEIINQHRMSTGVFNVPMTYPPEMIDGFMISGMDAPIADESIAKPKRLFHEVEKNCGKYIVESDAARIFRTGKLQEAFLELKNFLIYQHKVAVYLYKKYECDFFMSVFSAVDRVQHLFWHLMDSAHLLYDERLAAEHGKAIYEIYRIQDEILSDILSSIKNDTTVLIMSDHGAGGHNFYKVISLNNWLTERGYMVLKTRKQTSGTREILRHLYVAGRNRLPRRLKDIANRFVPGIRQQAATGFNFASVNWQRSLVYADFPFPYLWINLKGREPEGIVEPGEEYEALRDELIAEFEKIIDCNTGKPIVKTVYRREEIFSGQALGDAPDLIVHFEGGYFNTRDVKKSKNGPSYLGQISEWEANIAPSGGHRMNGIFMGLGAPLKQGYLAKGMKIIDIAPLICYLMGIPIPAHFDGQFFDDIIVPSYLKSHPVTYGKFMDGGGDAGTSYGKEEAAVIKQRLKDLGYA